MPGVARPLGPWVFERQRIEHLKKLCTAFAQHALQTAVAAETALVVLRVEALDDREIRLGGTNHRADIDLAGGLHQAHAAATAACGFQQANGR